MSLDATHLKFYESSHSTGSGDTLKKSLGGAIKTSAELPATPVLNDLFDLVTGLQNRDGETNYRIFYLKNTHATQSALDVRLTISGNDVDQYNIVMPIEESTTATTTALTSETTDPRETIAGAANTPVVWPTPPPTALSADATNTAISRGNGGDGAGKLGGAGVRRGTEFNLTAGEQIPIFVRRIIPEDRDSRNDPATNLTCTINAFFDIAATS